MARLLKALFVILVFASEADADKALFAEGHCDGSGRGDGCQSTVTHEEHEVWTAADDECSKPGDPCGLNALQLSWRKFHSGRRLDECAAAVQGDSCWTEVQWAKSTGIIDHPEWYAGLNPSSSEDEFQCKVHQSAPAKCPRPCIPGCNSPGASASGKVGGTEPDLCANVQSDACLCVFDIDRTLTGSQGVVGPSSDALHHCPANSEVEGVFDTAYGTGTFTLSQLTTKGINSTFCGKCYIGICSHGDAARKFSPERMALLTKVLHTKPMEDLRLTIFDSPWSDETLRSPFVVSVPDGKKQFQVENILKWYARQEVCILKSNTYFFDDRADNVAPFAGTGMNAKQISCSTRDGDVGNGAVGLCGATTDEIVPRTGIELCKVNCVWSTWTVWSACSKTCGAATQQRSRHKWVHAANGGAECDGSPVDTNDCALDPCPTAEPGNQTGADAATNATNLKLNSHSRR